MVLQLGLVRVWWWVAVVVTVALTGCFLVGTVRFLPKPWYPLLTAFTLAFGAWWLRELRRTATSLELAPDRRSLTVRGVGSTRRLDLTGLQHVEQGTRRTGLRRSFQRTWVEVALVFDDRRVRFRASGRSRTESFVNALAGVVPVIPATAGYDPFGLDLARPGVEHLNSFVFTATPLHLVAVSVLGAALVFAAIFAVPLAFWTPPTQFEPVSSAGLQGELAPLVEELAGQAEPVPAVATTRGCRRQWPFWYPDDPGRRSISVTASAPMSGDATPALASRLEATFSGTGAYATDDLWMRNFEHFHLTLELEGEELRGELRALCVPRDFLDSGGTEKLRATVGSLVAGLAAPSR